MGLVAERVAGLRLFQFHAGDDVTGIRFGNFVELLPLHRVQRAQSFRNSARRVVDRRVRADFAAENFEDVNASREGIGDCAEAISRERFTA